MECYCELTCDLGELPLGAITKSAGPEGEIYTVTYDLGLVFGSAEIEFKLVYQGRVVGSIYSKYI